MNNSDDKDLRDSIAEYWRAVRLFEVEDKKAVEAKSAAAGL